MITMRLKLEFELAQKELPKDNKNIWISFLKNVLSVCNDGKFYDQYFGGTEEKDYTFSMLLPKPQFVEEKILLDSTRISMIFSADDRKRSGLIFFSAFIQAKGRKFPLPNGNSMVLRHICQLREQLITSSKIMCKTVIGGGIVVRDHDQETNRDKYYTFQDAEFEEKLKEVLKVQAEKAGFAETIADTIKIVPIQCKKVLVKFYNTYVDCTTGVFQMEGDTSLLQYFYQAGLGSRHSAGFGMIDIIFQENEGGGRM